MAFKMPRFEMTSDFRVWLTALISDSAVDVDTLPGFFHRPERVNSIDTVGI